MRSTVRRWLVFGVLATLGAAASATNAELVVNGGFESGAFAPWFAPPNVPLGQPDPQYFQIGNNAAHGGVFFAIMSSTQTRFMSQVLPTTAGSDYELSFWVRRTSASPDTFLVKWEGAVVWGQFMSGSNYFEWRNITVSLHSNITGSLLEFGQDYFPGEFHLDDVSVIPVPAPSAAAVLLMGGAAAAMRRRRT